MTKGKDSETAQTNIFAVEERVIAAVATILESGDHDTETLHATLAELKKHQEKLAVDQELVEEILEKMHTRRSIDAEKMRYIYQSMDKVSGDLLFSCRRPDGVRHILIGDITGHGLPAAIVGPEVSDIFYTMTIKGFAPVVILMEINQRLRGRLPVGIYMAATIVELNEPASHAKVWNGGLPDGLLFRDAKVINRFPSASLPLGIIDNDRHSWPVSQVHIEPGDRIVLFSDGITEPRNRDGEMFGPERFEMTMQRILATDGPLEMVVEAMLEFTGDKERVDDDITMVEVTC